MKLRNDDLCRDRDVAQEVIKEIAQSHAPSNSAAVQFKIVLLNEVDKMSRDGQAALRRTMEKYTSACRFVLVCNNASKVSDVGARPGLMLWSGHRAPEKQMHLLESPGAGLVTSRVQVKKELPVEVATKISNLSNRNLRKALLMLESTYVKFGVVDESVLTCSDGKHTTDLETVSTTAARLGGLRGNDRAQHS
eukprot:415844-Hanusia_phi.AAC.2